MEQEKNMEVDATAASPIQKACKWLKYQIIERPLDIDEPAIQRKYWFRAWVASVVYSLIYGQYEYWVVYTGPTLIKDLEETVNWSIMYGGVILVCAVASKFRIQEILFGVIMMAMLEDVSFWVGLWIDTEEFPFPAGNWWDHWFASFRALGGLGQPVDHWPYFPTYYWFGFGMRIGYDICSFRGPKPARVWACITGPMFLAVLLGTFWPPCEEVKVEDCGPDDDVLAFILSFISVSIISLFGLYVHKYGFPNLETLKACWARERKSSSDNLEAVSLAL